MQHEACTAYIASQKHEGWKLLPSRYDDGGKSGGTLERPALQRLLEDIDAGRIDMVVVYKIDRLTRSLSDFAKLVDRFEEVGCSFVSVTQAFNTSSSMGRLTLNVLLSFAQFEGEVTAERIRDKIAASKKKGLWMGGVAPLGYDPHPNPNRRELVLNEVEAQTVRRIFDFYKELGCLNAVMRQSTESGLTSKRHVFSTGRVQGGRPFGRGQIYHLLCNPTYLGQIRHKDKTYPGQHPVIITQDQWDRVQSKLEAAAMRRRGKAGTASSQTLNDHAPLLGKLRDETGDLLTPSHTQKVSKRHRYYVSNRLIVGKPGPSGWRLPAKTLEQAVEKAVVDHLRTVAKRHEVLAAADVAGSFAATDAVNGLITRLDAEVIKTIALVIQSGTLGNGQLCIKLSAETLVGMLKLKPGDLHPTLLDISVPIIIRRRSAEMKIIAGERHPTPDKTLLQALRNAHAWIGEMKSGTSIRAVATKARISESYVTRILPLAFLSPRIQNVILSGTQPVELTLETLVCTTLPLDWSAQERLLGFA